jgi:hypothetical protein
MSLHTAALAAACLINPHHDVYSYIIINDHYTTRRALSRPQRITVALDTVTVTCLTKL